MPSVEFHFSYYIWQKVGHICSVLETETALVLLANMLETLRNYISLRTTAHKDLRMKRLAQSQNNYQKMALL